MIERPIMPLEAYASRLTPGLRGPLAMLVRQAPYSVTVRDVVGDNFVSLSRDQATDKASVIIGRIRQALDPSHQIYVMDGLGRYVLLLRQVKAEISLPERTDLIDYMHPDVQEVAKIMARFWVNNQNNRLVSKMSRMQMNLLTVLLLNYDPNQEMRVGNDKLMVEANIGRSFDYVSRGEANIRRLSNKVNESLLNEGVKGVSIDVGSSGCLLRIVKT